MCRYLVDVLILEERAQEASQTAAAALEAVPAGDPYARAVEAHMEATLAVLDGRRAGAERRFEDALKLLETQHLALDLGEERLAYARSLIRLGDPDAARHVLLVAYEALEPLGARRLIDAIDVEFEAIARATAEV